MTLPVVLTAGTSAYNIQRSLRFRSSASANLTRTVTGVNTTQLTFSFWLKYSVNPSDNVIYATSNNSSNYLYIGFNSSYALDVQIGATANRRVTTQVFRDPSAWYHIVVTFDTTQATASDRIKIYVNGSQVTAFSTNTTGMSQNSNLPSISSTLTNYIGNYNGSAGFYYDGYMAELNAVYGQALTPSSFGQTNSATGVWQPAKYTGTYGTNGFYLPFTDTTSTTTISEDFSGNNNDWTSNNISLTSGATYDSMTDVPTNTNSNTANYCVINPLDASASTVSNGNLNITYATNSDTNRAATFGVSSGKWYWETTITAVGGTYSIIGITSGASTASSLGTASYQYSYISSTGNKFNNGSSVAYGATYTTGDVIGIALDMDAGTLTFYKNNTSQGTAYTGLSGTFFPAFNARNASSNDANFGQRPFAYTPPSGFVALNTFNLPTPTIGATASSQANKYFDVNLWSGTSSSQTITNSGFQPDLVWTKNRNGTNPNLLNDSVRGITAYLQSNATNAEATDATSFTSFNSNGFTLGANTGGGWNTSGQTYVGWQWRASNTTAVTNTAGSITSTVSANTTAGFSIVTYTGTGVTGTLGHGLGVAPAMIIVKSRSNASNWYTYHISIGNTGAVALNLTDATITSANFWNNTSPTSSVFTASAGSAEINGNGLTYVAYCFAQVAGYSAFGSYTGNGSSDGTFVYTGFRPRWIMIKPTNVSGEYWQIIDTSRNPYNADPANMLSANLANAEAGISSQTTDILSNGFKLRGTSGNTNGSGNTYIYAAFAENPLKYSLAR